jgi:hypothetical protein
VHQAHGGSPEGQTGAARSHNKNPLGVLKKRYQGSYWGKIYLLGQALVFLENHLPLVAQVLAQLFGI